MKSKSKHQPSLNKFLWIQSSPRQLGKAIEYLVLPEMELNCQVVRKNRRTILKWPSKKSLAPRWRILTITKWGSAVIRLSPRINRVKGSHHRLFAMSMDHPAPANTWLMMMPRRKPLGASLERLAKWNFGMSSSRCKKLNTGKNQSMMRKNWT